MTWAGIVELMMAELRTGSPRAQSYWAQQLAFGPVLVNALALGFRERLPADADQEAVTLAVRLALGGLGPLPDEPGIEPALLAVLARRQARAVAWGRARILQRLLRRLGAGVQPETTGATTLRLVRPYPIIGWGPDQRLSA